MGAVRTWSTGKEVYWQIFIPDRSGMILVQRTARRLLFCTIYRGEVGIWSPRTAEATDNAIWSDFSLWMDQQVLTPEAFHHQEEFWPAENWTTKGEAALQRLGVDNELSLSIRPA